MRTAAADLRKSIFDGWRCWREVKSWVKKKKKQKK
jgi:hypothetical protein